MRLIISAIAVLCCLLSLSFAEAFVAADSITGKVEVRKAGQERWVSLAKGAKLYNNDVVRAGDSAYAILKSASGQSVFVHGNSQILVNCFENKERNFLSQHFTLFSGAAFFLLKNVLPQTQNDIKVFTPTAVLATRGTSFEVNVVNKTGSTAVKVLNGTILVRNILKNVSTFLKAGNKTVVDMNSDPLAPKGLLETDITQLAKWVSRPIIDKEISLQLDKGHRDQLAMTGKTENKILLLPLENKSQYSGKWKISERLGAYLAAGLIKSTENTPISVADSTVTKDPLEAGQQQEARYVLSGTVDNFEIVQRAKISTRADEYTEYATAQINLHMQLIDTKTARVINDAVYAGEVTGPNSTQNSWQTIGGFSFDNADKRFSESILGKAVSQAIEQAAYDMGKYVKGGE
jgi:hypothetical protein